MNRLLTSVALAVTMLGTSACSVDEPLRASEEAGPEVPRYHRDVAPILAQNCFQCHRDGGAGPFILEEYEEVSQFGGLVGHVVTERIMPPWLADNSGDCRTYEDAAWLSDLEIDTIADWVAGGMPEGDPEDSPRFLDDAPHIDQPDVLLTIADPYTPTPVDGTSDDYRCFVIDPGIDERQFITSYEVIPGDPKIVHHVIVYHPMSDEDAEEAIQLDAEQPGQGYECFGGPIVDAYVAAAWAPGSYVWDYPNGTGVPLEPRPMIVQMHYNVVAGMGTDQSSVAITTAPAVDDELLPWFFANPELALNPGQDDAIAKWEISNKVYMEEGYGEPWLAIPQTLVGIGPHMHQLGRSLNLSLAKADGSGTECLIDVPRWDFNWQFAYFLEEPVRIEPQDLMRMTCTFDTRGKDDMVYWGDNTSDEMCLTLMFSTFDGGKIPEGTYGVGGSGLEDWTDDTP